MLNFVIGGFAIVVQSLNRPLSDLTVGTNLGAQIENFL